jgi:uncharacterized damage-inducible protein DinB
VTRAISLASINELFNYSYWARDCQLQACEILNQEQLLHSLPSSFPSVRDTLVHMIGAEWVWLERWRGGSPKFMLSAHRFRSLRAVSEQWSRVEREMRNYLGTLDEEVLQKPVTYVSQKGDMFTYELWRLMLHLVNHQSYHRGQVATLLRQLKVQPPAVDLLPGYRVGFSFR